MLLDLGDVETIEDALSQWIEFQYAHNCDSAARDGEALKLRFEMAKTRLRKKAMGWK